jgi:vacuolar protein sorting-associated protein 1
MISEEGSWSCIITLNREYEMHGNLSTPTRTRFGPVITEKALLKIWIRRAQAAILSPHRDDSDFHAMGPEEIRQALDNDTQSLEFSKNTIEIEVHDPELVPLTFVDLPGKSSIPLCIKREAHHIHRVNSV